MKLVDTILEIERNIKTLGNYSSSVNSVERKFYIDLIRRGTCFLIYEENKEIKYAPSRFIGYKNNQMDIHLNTIHKDGRETSNRITKIIGAERKVILNAEYGYITFCKQLNFNVKPFGTYGAPRKYWFLNSSIESKLNTVYTDSEKEYIDNEEIMDTPDETSKKALIQARKGQGRFRDKLIKLWQECPITKCDQQSLLRASHIKPWRYSSNKERLDEYNGILFSPTYDLLFDEGIVSFNEEGEIIISSKLSFKNIKNLNINLKARIEFHENNKQYLRFHRSNIFKK